MTWRPIETAEEIPDQGPILLARFRDSDSIPDYVVSASYGVAMPGWIHLASYAGWFVDGVPLEGPERYRSMRVAYGILPRGGEGAPTHWMRIPKL